MNTMKTASRISAYLLVALVLLPATSFAQNNGNRPPRGGGGGGMMANGQVLGLLQSRAILEQLDLTDDQKSKTDDLLKTFMQSMRDARQGMQDASPEERRQKMEDMQTQASDTMDKIQDVLTPEQKEKFATSYAEAALKRNDDLLDAVVKATGDLDLDDEKKKQLALLADDTKKTLEGFKPEAAEVKDYSAAKDFSTKVGKSMADARRQLVDILGQDDAQKAFQTAQRSMLAGGRQPNNRRAGGAKNPATQPAN